MDPNQIEEKEAQARLDELEKQEVLNDIYPKDEASENEPANEEAPGESDEESPKVEAAEEEAGEEALLTDESYLEELQSKLGAVDQSRWDGLVDQFQNDQEISNDDVKWIAEVLEKDVATVRYGINLQRDLFRHQSKEAAEASKMLVQDLDTSLGGDGNGREIAMLVQYGLQNAPEEQANSWRTVLEFAAKRQDDNLTASVINEIKEFRDSHAEVANKGAKTLAHLGRAQSNPPQSEQPEPEQKPANRGPEPDPQVLAQLGRFSSEALAQLVLNPRGSDKDRYHAQLVLASRGIA